MRRRDRFHRDHGGTVLREDGHDEIARVIGVLHHEHAYAVERAETRRRVAVARRPGRRHLVRRGLVGKPNGQRDGECRAAPLTFAPHAHGTAVQLDEMAHDREAEAEAAILTRARALRLAEAIEDVRQELHTDAGARVRNDDARLAWPRLEGHVDAAARRRELDRVRQEVPDDLLEPVRIDQGGRGRRRQMRAEHDVLAVGGRADAVDGALDDAAQVHRPHVETEPAGHDA